MVRLIDNPRTDQGVRARALQLIRGWGESSDLDYLPVFHQTYLSDPMVVLYIKGRDGLLQEIGRTEVVLNTLSPKWIRKFTATYQFEIVQNLVFCVYDVDTQFHGIDVKALKLEEQRVLGEASCILSEIATKLYWTLTLDLAREEVSAPAHTRKCGQLTVYAEKKFYIKDCSRVDIESFTSKTEEFSCMVFRYGPLIG